MSTPERRGGRRMTRKKREQRAYQLTLATGGFGLVGVVGTVLAIFTGVGFFGWPLLFLVLAVISFGLLRSTLGGK